MENISFLEDLTPSLYGCMKCRWCIVSCEEKRTVCPMNERFKFRSYSAGGVVDMVRSIYEGQLSLDKEAADVLYACTMCEACAKECGNTWYLTNEHFNVPLLIKKMREELIDKGMVPPLVRDYLDSIYKVGNPFNLPKSKRVEWTKEVEVEIYKDQEYLLYVGCVGSFDDKGQKIARAVCDVLNKTGVSYGILGKEEVSAGNEVDALGESGLLEFLIEKNMDLFKKKDIKKIITLSPHGYNIIKKEYPKDEHPLEVIHYTQFFSQLIDQGKLSLLGYDAKVTYHDPCYLGRRNNEYEAPRKILNSIPKLSLIEMKQNYEKAFCCGGGGGIFFTDILGGSTDSPNRIRVNQALDTGAEVVAVACPQCAKMLEDGIKVEKLDDKLEVKDIAEILADALEA